MIGVYERIIECGNSWKEDRFGSIVWRCRIKHRPGGVVYVEVVHRGGMDEDMRRLVIGTGVFDVDGAEQDRV